jgi:hypothetical protein
VLATAQITATASAPLAAAFSTAVGQRQGGDYLVPVGHPDDKNVVELVHTVNLGKELIHHSVVHTWA